MLTLTEVLEDFAQFVGVDSGELVQPNSADARGTTPLHWMATLGDPAAIRLLVSAGARTDAQDNAGNTPLHEAVLSRQAVAVEALLQAGANRELKNLEGFTPADIAARDGYGPTAAALARM